MKRQEYCYETRLNLSTARLICPTGAELIWKSPIYKFMFPYEITDNDEQTYKEIVMDVTASAPSFDATMKTMQKVLDEVLEMLPRKPIILDFGAGKFRNTLYLLEKGYDVCAVEFERIQRTPLTKELYERAGSFGKQFRKLVFPHEFFSSELRFNLIMLINVCSIMPVPSERLLVLQYCREKLIDNGLILWYTLHKDAYVQARCVDEVKIGDGYYMHKANRYHTFYRDFENHEIDAMFLANGLRFKQLIYAYHNQARLYTKAGNNPIKEVLNAKKIRQYVKGDLAVEAPKDANIRTWYNHENPSINIPNPNELADESIYIDALRKLLPGKRQATTYHNLMAAILIKLFMPPLTKPYIEQEIDTQLKRIDLVMNNPINDGFFGSLNSRFGVPASYIIIECKNYEIEVENKEIDQLSERLKRKRGMFGILAYRKTSNEQELLSRCRQLVEEQKRIICLNDNDIILLLQIKLAGEEIDDYLDDKMRKLVN